MTTTQLQNSFQTLKTASQGDFKRILCLSPHPDDGLLGAGGTISRFKEEGKDVIYVIFSWAEQGFDWKEIERATPGAIILNYKVREFPRYRQEILEEMIKLRKQVNPDMVFVPSSFDTHQDHQVIHQEGVRAFRNYTLLGYEESWNNIRFSSRCFVPLKGKHIKDKVNTARIYETQKNKIYMDTDLIEARARDRGTYIRTKYAEAYEVIRWII